MGTRPEHYVDGIVTTGVHGGYTLDPNLPHVSLQHPQGHRNVAKRDISCCRTFPIGEKFTFGPLLHMWAKGSVLLYAGLLVLTVLRSTTSLWLTRRQMVIKWVLPVLQIIQQPNLHHPTTVSTAHQQKLYPSFCQGACGRKP